MTATTITAADKAKILRSLDGVLPEAHAQKLHDFLFVTLPAMILSDVANLLQTVKDVTAVKAIDVTTLQDKALIFVEDVGQLFQYDADSSAPESLGPPAMIVQPTTGGGRYIALTLGFYATPQSYVDARLRLVADVNAVKAIDVTTLVDKALVYVEGTGQFFAYDSGSVAAESLGPPATVIQPTAGAGRYLVFVGTTSYVDARIRLVADNTALKAVDVTTLVDKALIYKEDTGQLFAYDSGSAATEVLGPPALIVQPTAGAGRYIALTGGSAAVSVKLLRTVADNTALKALDVATLADKALIFKEDTEQLFHYDADSAATEVLGPPATVVQPTAGAGRYIAVTDGTLKSKQLRLVQDVAAAKALDVTTLADKALVYVEDLKQVFAYDSGSAATDDSGSPSTIPVTVIQPTAGAGRYLALSHPPAPFTWAKEGQFAADPGAGDELPNTANGTYANANRLTSRVPCKGILKVWYIGQANPAGIDDGNTSVFKLIKSDDSALITKTFNTATQPGNAYVPTLLGTCPVAAGDMLAWEFVNGATADLPKFGLEFDLTPIA